MDPAGRAYGVPRRRESRARFLERAGISLARAARAVAESADDIPDEVVQVQVLLAWLCWSAGPRLEIPDGDADDVASQTAALACLADVALPVCDDEAGSTALQAALEETDRLYVDAGDWMRALQALAGALRKPMATPELRRRLQQGDLVIAGEVFGVARKVYGNKVDVVDPTHERGFRTFSWIASVAWIGLPGRRAREQVAPD